MSWIVELENIRKELYDEVQNKEIPEPDVTFIPHDRIQEVWAGERLDRFLRDALCDPDHGTDQAISRSQIREARDSLLRMISLLVGIHWSGWSRFKEIFFLHPTAATERRDRNIKNLTYNDLKHESFLGDTPFIDQFLQNRWIYIPIVLDGDIKAPFEPGTRLPLVRQDGTLRKGGFGEVTKEEILPKHIILGHSNTQFGLEKQTNSTKLKVARKRFRNGQYDVELRQLRFIQSSLSTHKRIVYPLATVKIGTDLNIIMPWADMDLEDYLNGGYQSMNPNPLLLRDLIKESGQLAAGLEFLHKGLQVESSRLNLPEQGICHADFRPRNILVFKQEDSSTGTWGITDFGLSQQSLRSLSRERNDPGFSSTRNSYAAPWGGVYGAPDANAHLRSDIWSFGCILVRIFNLGLEHSLAHRPELDASRERPFDWQNIKNSFFEGNPPALKHNVQSWIESLPARYCQIHSIGFLMEMRNLLLWMLKIDYSDRPKAPNVRSRLHKLYHMAIEPAPESVDSSSMVSVPTTPNPRKSSGSTIRTFDPPLDRFGVGALVSSIKSGSVDNVKYSLQGQPDVEEAYEGDRPLIHAIKESNFLIIQALLDHKPDLDVRTCSSQDERPLHLAISIGDVEVVRVLIDALIQNGFRDSLDEIYKDKKTPLMVAASKGHVAVVSLLLDKGADATICTGEYQQNCLHHAVDNISAGEDLLSAFVGRMDFNQTPDGLFGYETPMMQHIKLGVTERYGTPIVNALWKEKFKVLKEGEGDVNRSYPQISPLQLAIEKDKIDIVEALLEAGATPPENLKRATKAMRDKIKRVRARR